MKKSYNSCRDKINKVSKKTALMVVLVYNQGEF